MSGKEQVSVTQPGGLYVDENLVPNGCGYVHILEVEPTTDTIEYKRLHPWPPYSRFEPTSRSRAAGRAMDWLFADSRLAGFPKSVALGWLFAAVHLRRISLK